MSLESTSVGDPSGNAVSGRPSHGQRAAPTLLTKMSSSGPKAGGTQRRLCLCPPGEESPISRAQRRDRFDETKIKHFLKRQTLSKVTILNHAEKLVSHAALMTCVKKHTWLQAHKGTQALW